MWMGPKATLAAKLLTTCKSHKPIVTFRNIHASASYAVGGLSQWVASQLTQELLKGNHIVKDTADFVSKTSSWVIHGPTCYFAKIDVKEYYLSGDVISLTKDACKNHS